MNRMRGLCLGLMSVGALTLSGYGQRNASACSIVGAVDNELNPHYTCVYGPNGSPIIVPFPANEPWPHVIADSGGWSLTEITPATPHDPHKGIVVRGSRLYQCAGEGVTLFTWGAGDAYEPVGILVEPSYEDHFYCLKVKHPITLDLSRATINGHTVPELPVDGSEPAAFFEGNLEGVR